jgi:hypothetical protein
LKDSGFSESSYIKIFDNDKDLINEVYRKISEIDELVISVPASSLERICAACVSKLSQTNRVIAYFPTEADLKRYKQNRSEHIDHKVQCCLEHDLRRFLDGAEIRSILYKVGPMDPSFLIKKLQGMGQRFSEKREAAEAVKILLSECL